MDANAPISLVVAAYPDLDDAGRDSAAVWAAREEGDFHHTSVALLDRDRGDDLQVAQTDSTAKHLVWGGALMGGAVFVLDPPTGAKLLTRTGLTGAGAIVAHVQRNARPSALADAAALLAASPTSLVVVAVNRRAAAVTALLGRAAMTATVDLVWGDLEEELCRDLVRPRSDALLPAS
ncbi:protein of unknown function [Modestobacter italicus]|uniref:Uncharacterized protein n=1 Tax=Modestobacter italicus (strain DSM 44449 / CECT 9708 / BC 501) TaxID=2732864 RepID=I4EXX4_MODI5|nr:hypothetical protein [Modestobacter marinus]CCH88237.1 protein of unknown function [Modestobacter marinus]